MGNREREEAPEMQVRWLSPAILDLVALRKYIEEDNPAAAASVAKRILTEIELLKDYPGMGKHGRVEGTRELVSSGLPYIIAYRVKNNAIEILRVLHGSMKWPERF